MAEALQSFVDSNSKKFVSEISDKLKGLQVETLPRMLGWIRHSVFFRHDKNNPLSYDVVVVDEASMIDGAMMSKLMDAIGDETTIFFDRRQRSTDLGGSKFGFWGYLHGDG